MSQANALLLRHVEEFEGLIANHLSKLKAVCSVAGDRDLESPSGILLSDSATVCEAVGGREL